MYVCMHILSYHVRAQRQDGPGGTHPGACAHFTTQREQPRTQEEEEPRWRRWMPTMMTMLLITLMMTEVMIDH